MNKSQEADVIVIGGGISGLVACKNLSSNSNNVMVLEARNRLGGRIHTITSEKAGAPIDLGAAWIHGHSKQNPIRQLVEQVNKNQDDKIRLFKSDWDSIKAYNTDDDNRTPKVISNRKVFQRFKQHDKLIQKCQDQLEDESADVSLEAAIQKVQPKALQDPIMGWILSVMEESDYGGSLDDLSTWYFDNDEEFPGQDALLSGGYKTLIDFVAKGLDVRTNVQVKSIQYDASFIQETNDKPAARRVRIETTNRGTFFADYCIVTVPLGVLKAEMIQFQPVLPLPKRNAIQTVGFGTIAKVVLVFEKAFWPRKTQLFCNISKSRTNGRERGKFPNIINLYPATKRPILVAFAEGLYVKNEMEQLDDETVVRQVMEIVRNMFGKESSTLQPLESFVTRWGTDPYSRGTYSYHAAGQDNGAWHDLAENVDNVLYFAGEHCSKRYRGTVHGAYLSGERAADEVYKQIKNEKSNS